MYVLPKPTRYWSLRFDGSASGSPTSFTSNNQGLDSAWPLWSTQLDAVTPVAGSNYLEATGYSRLHYSASVAASTRVGNTYTDLALIYKEAYVSALNAPLMPTSFYNNWTVHLWAKGLTGVANLQIIYMNGGFYKARGDTFVKPYFMYALVVENNVLKFLVFNKAGNVETEAAIPFDRTLLDSAFNTWSSITVSNNFTTRQVTLSLNSPRKDIFGRDNTVYNYSVTASYTIDNIHLDPQTNIGDWRVYFGRLFNYGRYNNPPYPMPHAQAKVFWPYGKNYTQYKNWTTLNRPPIAIPYVPKDTDIEDYGVSTTVDICHLSVWATREVDGEYLAQIKYPFDTSVFSHDVFCGNNSEITYVPIYNFTDTLLVDHSTVASFKLFEFANSVGVTHSVTVQAPKGYNIVDKVIIGSTAFAKGPILQKMRHDVKVVDQARPNIFSFDIIDGVVADDVIGKRGTIRFNIVDSVGASDAEEDQPPQLLTAYNTITIGDFVKSSNTAFRLRHDIIVSDTVFKTGPVYFQISTGLKISDKMKINKMLPRSLITCVKLRDSGNPGMEFSLSNSITVGQSETHIKVYAFRSSIVVGQSVVPSDIDYSDPCRGDIVKANRPAFTTSLQVTDAVGIVSGVTYPLDNSITVNDSVVGFLLRTTGYNPFSGAI